MGTHSRARPLSQTWKCCSKTTTTAATAASYSSTRSTSITSRDRLYSSGGCVHEPRPQGSGLRNPRCEAPLPCGRGSSHGATSTPEVRLTQSSIRAHTDDDRVVAEHLSVVV